MLAPEVRSIGRSICSIPAMPGRPDSSPSPKRSAPSIASAMWVATGSTSRRQTGSVCSIHSARLHAETLLLTRGNWVAASNQTSAIDAASVSARCWAAVGVGSGPSPAAVLRAVSFVTSQFTPDPESVPPAANMPPEPPSIANAFCSCDINAFMSPLPSWFIIASNGLAGG